MHFDLLTSSLLTGFFSVLVAAGVKLYKWRVGRREANMKIRIEMENRIDKDHKIKTNTISLDRSLIIAKTIKQLGEDINAHKIVSMLVHNGGGLLRPDREYNGTVLDEFADLRSAPNPRIIKETRLLYQNFPLENFAKGILLRLSAEKEIWISYNDLPLNGQMRDAYDSEGWKSECFNYVGCTERGMIVLMMSYQDKVSEFKSTDGVHVSSALSELRQYFESQM